METFMSALTPIETSQGPNTQVQPALVNSNMLSRETENISLILILLLKKLSTFPFHLLVQPLNPYLCSNIQGAGGILMIVPLFQRVPVSECGSRKIPVIFDESTSELLGCLPDIACYAKLMTGVIVPLSATLAIEEVFESFESDSKFMALLHDHSYTAHAMGYTATLNAMD
ncbi:Bifunctional dethiobiotin synthetase/7,8-diamino-pelargonic acid aminotransferase, mitochondrial [Zea mays]|uniref:Bifunctional dethiobiotin synthetase/7,8-diamino-pelargonic acid aminotransferase, mitochondrial n=1 Tax=Zea mays TaxID=4577 RepID=A0A3L6DF05_MAIZE|nr:Bifunctional dethiobiotin synthetase/7,8-diamino-pelargonic acid aminotransferase, mitochondrial [Zea mays]